MELCCESHQLVVRRGGEGFLKRGVANHTFLVGGGMAALLSVAAWRKSCVVRATSWHLEMGIDKVTP
jgi:hypothetical protein